MSERASTPNRSYRPAPLRTRTTLAAALIALSASTRAFAAQSCAAGDRECGRVAFSEGTAAFDRGAFSEALDRFRAAQAAEPHASTSFNIALCYLRLGKPTLARDELSPLRDSSDPELAARAQRELANAEAALAYVVVEAPDPVNFPIQIDGTAVSTAGTELAVDPGQHRFRVTNAGNAVFDQALNLQPGEHLRLRVTAQTRNIDVVVVPGRARNLEEAPKAAEPARHTLPPAVFYASAAATVLVGAATIWSGLDVQRAYDSYRADLPHLDQAAADARVDDGHSRELRTNVLLGTTIAAAAVTLVTLIAVEFDPHPQKVGQASHAPGLTPLRLRF